MATFTWKNRLHIWVGEMSRTSAMVVSREFRELGKLGIVDEITLADAIGTLLAVHAPCAVSFDGKMLTDGTHKVMVNDQPITLTLPMTKECFGQIPTSLSKAWVEVAQKENEWVNGILFLALNPTMPNNSEPLPDSALS